MTSARACLTRGWRPTRAMQDRSSCHAESRTRGIGLDGVLLGPGSNNLLGSQRAFVWMPLLGPDAPDSFHKVNDSSKKPEEAPEHQPDHLHDGTVGPRREIAYYRAGRFGWPVRDAPVIWALDRAVLLLLGLVPLACSDERLSLRVARGVVRGGGLLLAYLH